MIDVLNFSALVSYRTLARLACTKKLFHQLCGAPPVAIKCNYSGIDTCGA